MRTPIVCAPMGGVAGGALATAVSRSGGLGLIGVGSAGTVALLERELSRVPGDVRVGIGLVDWVVRRHPALLDLALAARPALLTVNFGTDLSWIAAAHDRGIATAVQISDLAEAERAARAGVDLLVARGEEGGGHGRPRHPRDVLLSRVLEITDRPVLAAGAIATVRDVHRVLGLGAAGVWVGTAFAACSEALSTPGERRALLAARGEDTILTSLFDRVAGHRWPADVPERVIGNAFTSRWRGSLRADRVEEARRDLHDAVSADDPDRRPVNAGLGVGELTTEVDAATVVAALTPVGQR